MSNTATYQCDNCKRYSRFPDPIPPEVIALMCSWCSACLMSKVDDPPLTLTPIPEKSDTTYVCGVCRRQITEDPDQTETITVDRRSLAELLDACDEVLQNNSIPLGVWKRLDSAVTYFALEKARRSK